MSEKQIENPFESYVFLSMLSARITAKTPLRIGAGKGFGALESDLPVVKDGKGRPFLPGSSLKGFVRGNTQRLLSNLYKDPSKLMIKVFGGSKGDEHASAILFHDIPALDYKLQNRQHISINPKRGAVQNLFNAESVLDGTVFEGHLATTRNLSPIHLGLFQPIFQLASLGAARLGGFKSRGYGTIEAKMTSLEFIIPGKSKDELLKGVEISVPIGSGVPVHLMADGESVVLKEQAETRFKAEVKPAPHYIGVSIEMSPDNLEPFLEDMQRQLHEYLRSKVGLP
ncbi:MAG: hypothetical protein JRJ77_07410 [Deltaproteobacteria bacterium]|nr:hypothetical protein [Deltaproteobacteria bacterium]